MRHDFPKTAAPQGLQEALVAIMVATCLADEDAGTAELVTIDQIVDHLPVFARFDDSRIRDISGHVQELFDRQHGLQEFFALIRRELPAGFLETAYALACDVAAADGSLSETELGFLQEIRHELDIDRLAAAAIERAAGARYRRLQAP